MIHFTRGEKRSLGVSCRTKGGGQLASRVPDNGTAYLQAGASDSLKCKFLNDSKFRVLSVDLAGYSDVVPDFVIQFVGYRPDGSTVTADFSGNGLNFQTYYFAPEFSGLSRFEIATIGWSLDNLVVSVPEPSTGALLILGGAVCVFKCRRRGTAGNAPG